jgi:hypothetical protein
MSPIDRIGQPITNFLRNNFVPVEPSHLKCAWLALAGHTQIVLGGSIFVESCLGTRPPQGSLPAQFAISIAAPLLGTALLRQAECMARALKWPLNFVHVGGAFVVAAVLAYFAIHPLQPIQHLPEWLIPLRDWLRRT